MYTHIHSPSSLYRPIITNYVKLNRLSQLARNWCQYINPGHIHKQVVQVPGRGTRQKMILITKRRHNFSFATIVLDSHIQPLKMIETNLSYLKVLCYSLLFELHQDN